jgi:Xaa-Pro aminopeptidase
MKSRERLPFAWFLAAIVASGVTDQNAVAADRGIPISEYQTRREAIMRKLPDGILLLHANTTLFSTDQMTSSAFHQDASFYYFTGLPDTVSAILAIDGRKKETWLFAPTKLGGLADLLHAPFVPIGSESEKRLVIDHVVNWDQFVGYIDRQLQADPSMVLYTEDVTPSIMTQPPPVTNPSGLAPVGDPLLLWKMALAQRWPKARIRSASDVILAMHLVKSEAEIALMRRVGALSAGAVLTGMRAIHTGEWQSNVEAEIVRQCKIGGGDGPSFWPGVLSGPNSPSPQLLEGPADYYHMNRMMKAGEVVHLDLGCEIDLYGGDVGRTVPVSGTFTPGQREVWDLLVQLYQAGLSTYGDGVRRDQVFAAALDKVREVRHKLRTDLGKRAAETVLGKDGTVEWFLHSSGVGAATTSPDVLHTEMIVVFEPYINLEGQGYYLEDMVLVKQKGYEILTAGLPYSSKEIETAMLAKVR